MVLKDDIMEIFSVVATTIVFHPRKNKDLRVIQDIRIKKRTSF